MRLMDREFNFRFFFISDRTSVKKRQYIIIMTNYMKFDYKIVNDDACFTFFSNIYGDKK